MADLKSFLRRFPFRIVRMASLEARAVELADKDRELDRIKRRDFVLFDCVRQIEWRLSLCYSRAADATVAWKIARMLIRDYAPPSSWWDQQTVEAKSG